MTEGAREKAARLEVHTIGYRSRCAAAACGNLARNALTVTDKIGRPLELSSLRHRHTREKIKSAGTAG